MKKFDIEIAVGIFIFIGILCMAYISIELGQIDFFGRGYYPLEASFSSVKGLHEDTVVEIAGVRVGRVQSIELDLETYDALVVLLIKNEIQVQDDAIASVRTKGILGEKYIEILPGGSDVILKEGELIFDTEPPLDLENVIKNFVFKKVDVDND